MFRHRRRVQVRLERRRVSRQNWPDMQGLAPDAVPRAARSPAALRRSRRNVA